MIQAVKQNEQARQEYRFMSGFEMDAWEEGRTQGFSDGSHQAKLETAAAMKLEGFAFTLIAKITGLSVEEVKAL